MALLIITCLVIAFADNYGKVAQDKHGCQKKFQLHQGLNINALKHHLTCHSRNNILKVHNEQSTSFPPIGTLPCGTRHACLTGYTSYSTLTSLLSGCNHTRKCPNSIMGCRITRYANIPHLQRKEFAESLWSSEINKYPIQFSSRFASNLKSGDQEVVVPYAGIVGPATQVYSNNHLTCNGTLESSREIQQECSEQGKSRTDLQRCSLLLSSDPVQICTKLLSADCTVCVESKKDHSVQGYGQLQLTEKNSKREVEMRICSNMQEVEKKFLFATSRETNKNDQMNADHLKGSSQKINKNLTTSNSRLDKEREQNNQETDVITTNTEMLEKEMNSFSQICKTNHRHELNAVTNNHVSGRSSCVACSADIKHDLIDFCSNPENNCRLSNTVNKSINITENAYTNTSVNIDFLFKKSSPNSIENHIKLSSPMKSKTSNEVVGNTIHNDLIGVGCNMQLKSSNIESTTELFVECMHIISEICDGIFLRDKQATNSQSVQKIRGEYSRTIEKSRSNALKGRFSQKFLSTTNNGCSLMCDEALYPVESSAEAYNTSDGRNANYMRDEEYWDKQRVFGSDFKIFQDTQRKCLHQSEENAYIDSSFKSEICDGNKTSDLKKPTQPISVVKSVSFEDSDKLFMEFCNMFEETHCINNKNNITSDISCNDDQQNTFVTINENFQEDSKSNHKCASVTTSSDGQESCRSVVLKEISNITEKNSFDDNLCSNSVDKNNLNTDMQTLFSEMCNMFDDESCFKSRSKSVTRRYKRSDDKCCQFKECYDLTGETNSFDNKRCRCILSNDQHKEDEQFFIPTELTGLVIEDNINCRKEENAQNNMKDRLLIEDIVAANNSEERFQINKLNSCSTVINVTENNRIFEACLQIKDNFNRYKFDKYVSVDYSKDNFLKRKGVCSSSQENSCGDVAAKFNDFHHVFPKTSCVCADASSIDKRCNRHGSINSKGEKDCLEVPSEENLFSDDYIMNSKTDKHNSEKSNYVMDDQSICAALKNVPIDYDVMRIENNETSEYNGRYCDRVIFLDYYTTIRKEKKKHNSVYKIHEECVTIESEDFVKKNEDIQKQEDTFKKCTTVKSFANCIGNEFCYKINSVLPRGNVMKCFSYPNLHLPFQNGKSDIQLRKRDENKQMLCGSELKSTSLYFHNTIGPKHTFIVFREIFKTPQICTYALLHTACLVNSDENPVLLLDMISQFFDCRINLVYEKSAFDMCQWEKGKAVILYQQGVYEKIISNLNCSDSEVIQYRNLLCNGKEEICVRGAGSLTVDIWMQTEGTYGECVKNVSLCCTKNFRRSCGVDVKSLAVLQWCRNAYITNYISSSLPSINQECLSILNMWNGFYMSGIGFHKKNFEIPHESYLNLKLEEKSTIAAFGNEVDISVSQISNVAENILSVPIKCDEDDVGSSLESCASDLSMSTSSLDIVTALTEGPLSADNHSLDYYSFSSPVLDMDDPDFSLSDIPESHFTSTLNESQSLNLSSDLSFTTQDLEESPSVSHQQSMNSQKSEAGLSPYLKICFSSSESISCLSTLEHNQSDECSSCENVSPLLITGHLHVSADPVFSINSSRTGSPCTSQEFSANGEHMSAHSECNLNAHANGIYDTLVNMPSDTNKKSECVSLECDFSSHLSGACNQKYVLSEPSNIITECTLSLSVTPTSENKVERSTSVSRNNSVQTVLDTSTDQDDECCLLSVQHCVVGYKPHMKTKLQHQNIPCGPVVGAKGKGKKERILAKQNRTICSPGSVSPETETDADKENGNYWNYEDLSYQSSLHKYPSWKDTNTDIQVMAKSQSCQNVSLYEKMEDDLRCDLYEFSKARRVLKPLATCMLANKTSFAESRVKSHSCQNLLHEQKTNDEVGKKNKYGRRRTIDTFFIDGEHIFAVMTPENSMSPEKQSGNNTRMPKILADSSDSELYVGTSSVDINNSNFTEYINSLDYSSVSLPSGCSSDISSLSSLPTDRVPLSDIDSPLIPEQEASVNAALLHPHETYLEHL